MCATHRKLQRDGSRGCRTRRPNWPQVGTDHLWTWIRIGRTCHSAESILCQKMSIMPGLSDHDAFPCQKKISWCLQHNKLFFSKRVRGIQDVVIKTIGFSSWRWLLISPLMPYHQIGISVTKWCNYWHSKLYTPLLVPPAQLHQVSHRGEQSGCFCPRSVHGCTESEIIKFLGHFGECSWPKCHPRHQNVWVAFNFFHKTINLWYRALQYCLGLSKPISKNFLMILPSGRT